MLVLSLNETTDQLAMPNIVHWYRHVLGRVMFVLRKVLQF